MRESSGVTQGNRTAPTASPNQSRSRTPLPGSRLVSLPGNVGDHRDRPAAPTGAANREPPRRRAWPPCWGERRELGHGASTAPRDRPRQPPHWAQPEGAPRRTTDHPHTATQVGARGLKPFPPLRPSRVIFFARILPGFFPRFPPETLAHPETPSPRLGPLLSSKASASVYTSFHFTYRLLYFFFHSPQQTGRSAGAGSPANAPSSPGHLTRPRHLATLATCKVNRSVK